MDAARGRRLPGKSGEGDWRSMPPEGESEGAVGLLLKNTMSLHEDNVRPKRFSRSGYRGGGEALLFWSEGKRSGRRRKRKGICGIFGREGGRSRVVENWNVVVFVIIEVQTTY